MLTGLLISMAIAASSGSHIPTNLKMGPERPASLASRGEKNVVKRNAQGYPFWGLLPVISSPPVIQVHHIIHLQSPNEKCFYPQRPDRPTTSRPQQPVDDLASRFGGVNETTTVKQPSPCVWAIISCCSPGNTEIRYACFELLGCEGAFWDQSPCTPRVVKAAANTALKFYMSASPPDNETNVIDFDPSSF